MAKQIENDLTTISVAGPTSAFGTLRKAGTMIYDRTNSKMYFLTADAPASSSLGTFTSKIEV